MQTSNVTNSVTLLEIIQRPISVCDNVTAKN